MFTRQTTRWVAGSRRDWETRLLRMAAALEYRTFLTQYFANTSISATLHQKISQQSQRINKQASLSKHKNYCALAGRARTFNRLLYLARHNIRKLAASGLISGLSK